MSPWNDMFYLSTSCWASWGPLTPSIVRQKVGVRWPTYPNFGWELGAAPALDRSHHGQWCLAGQQLCWGRVGRYLPHVSWSPCSWRMSEGGVGKARKPVRGFQSSSQIRAFPRARLWAKSSKVLNAGPCTSRILHQTQNPLTHFMPAIDSKFAVPVSHLQTREREFSSCVGWLGLHLEDWLAPLGRKLEQAVNLKGSWRRAHCYSFVLLWLVTIKIYQSFQNFLFAPEYSCMRATELVGRADKEITAERLKIVHILLQEAPGHQEDDEEHSGRRPHREEPWDWGVGQQLQQLQCRWWIHKSWPLRPEQQASCSCPASSQDGWDPGGSCQVWSSPWMKENSDQVYIRDGWNTVPMVQLYWWDQQDVLPLKSLPESSWQLMNMRVS